MMSREVNVIPIFLLLSYWIVIHLGIMNIIGIALGISVTAAIKVFCAWWWL